MNRIENSKAIHQRIHSRHEAMSSCWISHKRKLGFNESGVEVQDFDEDALKLAFQRIVPKIREEPREAALVLPFKPRTEIK